MRINTQSFLRRWASFIYLAIALPNLFLINFYYPNLHAPDDPDHVKRAYTLAHNPIAIVNLPGHSSGSTIDIGLLRYVDQRLALVTIAAPQTSVMPTRIEWRHKEQFSEMSGAISYMPLLYAPQTVVLILGERMRLSIDSSIHLARLANGICGLALIFLGLRLLPFGHALCLVLLLLPRTMLQLGSNSADPILYGISLLIIAVGLRGVSARKKTAIVSAAGLAIASAVRPPVAALGLIPLLSAQRERSWAILLSFFAAVSGAAIWVLWAIPQIVERRCVQATGAVGAKFTLFLVEWPRLLSATTERHGDFILFSLVGHFGWGNAVAALLEHPLPFWLYPAWFALLLVAIVTDASTSARLGLDTRLTLLFAAGISILLSFLAMYLLCTAPAQSVIEGVQGRYLIPALLAVGPASSNLTPRFAVWWTPTFLILVILASFATTVVLVAKVSELYPVIS